jgi:hypothetical protein
MPGIFYWNAARNDRPVFPASVEFIKLFPTYFIASNTYFFRNIVPAAINFDHHFIPVKDPH